MSSIDSIDWNDVIKKEAIGLGDDNQVKYRKFMEMM